MAGVVLGTGYLLIWVVGAGALALFYVYGAIGSAWAYTRVGPGGFRTRYWWGGSDGYRWDQVANVAVHMLVLASPYRCAVSYLVVVTTIAGDRVRLGVPMSTTRGPEFTRAFRQVRKSWQDATGITGTPDDGGFMWPAEVYWRAAAAAVQIFALVVVFVTWRYFGPAWAAHEGRGTP